MESRPLLTFCLDTLEASSLEACTRLAHLNKKQQGLLARKLIQCQWLIRDTMQAILATFPCSEVRQQIEQIHWQETQRKGDLIGKYLNALHDAAPSPTPHQQAGAIVLAETRNEAAARLHQFSHRAFRIFPLKSVLYRQTPWASSITQQKIHAAFAEVLTDVNKA